MLSLISGKESRNALTRLRRVERDKGPVKNSPTVCEDDPLFLYKDKPGFNCALLAANKPYKCLKLHGNKTM